MEDKDLQKALNVWRAGHVPSGSDHHLSDEQLYRLAESGGVAGESGQDIEHLSTCPDCMERWAEWLDTIAIAGSDGARDVSEISAGVGFLKAASASLYREPLSLESSCGRFELTIYPDLDVPGRALLAVEALENRKLFEGKSCIVRDKGGTVIVSGSFEDGRLAGNITDISGVDLDTWTIVVN